MILLLACTEAPDDTAKAPSGGCFEAIWYVDADGDGWGAGAVSACDPPEGSTDTPGDCDDADAAAFPGAEERCDGRDQDCDGEVDEGLPTTESFPDNDGDGFGMAVGAAEFCEVPEGWVIDATDCDDADAAINPLATEVCNGVDDDCDDLIDDEDTAVSGVSTWYADADGDTFGDADNLVARCAAPAGYGTDQSDCDDSDATVNPAATEVCYDLVDQDCDGIADDYDATCEGSGVENPAEAGCDPTVSPVDSAFCGEGIAAVDAVGTGFASIQDAIDAALPGDIVTVCPGTWTQNLVQRASPLTLVGYGVGTSVVSGPGRLMDMGVGSALTLVDLSFVDGSGLLGNNATLCLERVEIDANTSADGAGLDLEGSGTFLAKDSTISNNRATGDGGGFRVDTYAVAFSGVVVSGNYAGYAGGGAEIDSDSVVVISDSVFSGNVADYTAGAIDYGGWTGAGSMEIATTTFAENRSGYEGGALTLGSWDFPLVTVRDSVFEGNVADNEGGAVNMGSRGGGTLTAIRTEFASNSSESGGGISIHAWGVPEVRLYSCTFDANAAESGAALSLNPVGGGSGAIATAIESTFSSNVSSKGCGAVSVDSVASSVFDSISTDWSTGASDNAPDDVCGYSWPGVATFECVGQVCI